MFDSLRRDLRQAIRMVGKHPGFSLIAIVSIAIGVGANAAMFSVADTLVLRPLTAPRPDEIVTVTAVTPRSGFASPNAGALAYPDFVDLRDRTGSFATLSAYRLVVTSFVVDRNQAAQRRFGFASDARLFEMLQVKPVLGRTFTPDDDRGPGRAVVVLDHDLWQRQFAGDAAVLGRLVRIGGTDFTVIGVLPSGFSGPDQFIAPAYYIPAALLPAVQPYGTTGELTRRDLHNFAVKGRLKPAVSIAQAREEAQLLAAALARVHPETNRNQGLTVRTEFEARLSARTPIALLAAMMMLLAAVVLCVACANVAGLLTSRGPVRAREMALRLAVGAGRATLIRQLLAETLLLAAAGGIAGLAVAYAILRLFQQIQLPTDAPLKFGFDLNLRVLVVALALAAASAVASALIPAWRSSRTTLVGMLGREAADAGRTRLWGRNLLVSAQVALTLVLLTVAVFLYRGYRLEFDRGPGFRTSEVLMATFAPELAGYDAPQTELFYQRLTTRLRSTPGVTAVGWTSAMHLDPVIVESTAITPEVNPAPAEAAPVRTLAARVGDDFFDMLGIRVVRGRAFREADDRRAPRVAIVNETLAAHYWPGQDPLGKRFRAQESDQAWVQIVGVAHDVKYRAVSEGPTDFVYYPLAQLPAPERMVLIHADRDVASLTAAMRDAVRSSDADVPVIGVRTLDDFFYNSTILLTTVLIRTVGGMGLMGLALAVIGLYGLVAYSASRRTREIGIRVAVGATPSSVLRMVLRHGLLLTLAGGVVGVGASLLAGNALRVVFPFPDLGRVDLPTYLVVLPALVMTTLLASYLPARRASHVDPLKALRQD